MQLLTVRDLAGILKVKEKTLYAWAEIGQIPCLKINGCLRFDYDEIMLWLKDFRNENSLRYNS